MSNLRDLQLIELEILKKALAVIEKHNLVYYMLGGTLLGAVRHRGFIPWDDDIDIGMPRPDYERFLRYAAEELEPPFQLHTLQENNGEYSYYYARMENTAVKLVRDSSMRKVVIPAWIDVFPLDGVPNDEAAKDKWINKCFRLYKPFYWSQYSFFASPRDGSPLKKAAKRLVCSLGLEKIISTKKAWERFDRALTENQYEECSRLINFCGYWNIKEMFPKSIYGKGQLYPFEGLMLNGPEDYDTVLTQMYGDYMTPPPEGKREHHYIEFCSSADRE